MQLKFHAYFFRFKVSRQVKETFKGNLCGPNKPTHMKVRGDVENTRKGSIINVNICYKVSSLQVLPTGKNRHQSVLDDFSLPVYARFFDNHKLFFFLSNSLNVSHNNTSTFRSKTTTKKDKN